MTQLQVRLADLVGAANVLTDDASRTTYGMDALKRGAMPDLVVRPGSTATALTTCQPAPSGRTSRRISRIVVSSETSAGRLMLALPGTCGTGMRAIRSAKASMRWRTETVGTREARPGVMTL